MLDLDSRPTLRERFKKFFEPVLDDQDVEYESAFWIIGDECGYAVISLREHEQDLRRDCRIERAVELPSMNTYLGNITESRE